KLAAQIANKQQKTAIEVTKPLIPVARIINETEDCIIVDVEDYKATGYSDVPMFVQHTEAMMEEIDMMDEKIEMEDAEDWSVVDIDSSDKKNELIVVEYIDDIYAYYKKAELEMLSSLFLFVRYKFELMEETLYLTMNLIDRLLTVQSVIRKKLQLVGITTLLFACKYEEVYVPEVEDLILISDKAYARKEVLEIEKLMVNALQFNMTVPTTYVFMRRFLKASQSDIKLSLLLSALSVYPGSGTQPARNIAATTRIKFCSGKGEGCCNSRAWLRVKGLELGISVSMIKAS
ncbi:Cyclin-B2-4, partial [Capsicum baccatum]